MLPPINKIKGVHPGTVLKRELSRRKLRHNALAKAIDEYPQTINAITKQRRGINPTLSIKLGKYFGLEADYFMFLQAAYEIEKVMKLEYISKNSLINKLPKNLFWDTTVDSIDEVKHKSFIIRRIFERGTPEHISAVIKRYGKMEVKKCLREMTSSFVPSFALKVKQFAGE